MTTGSKGKNVVFVVSRTSRDGAMNLPIEVVDSFEWELGAAEEYHDRCKQLKRQAPRCRSDAEYVRLA